MFWMKSLIQATKQRWNTEISNWCCQKLKPWEKEFKKGEKLGNNNHCGMMVVNMQSSIEKINIQHLVNTCKTWWILSHHLLCVPLDSNAWSTWMNDCAYAFDYVGWWILVCGDGSTTFVLYSNRFSIQIDWIKCKVQSSIRFVLLMHNTCKKEPTLVHTVIYLFTVRDINLCKVLYRIPKRPLEYLQQSPPPSR